MAEIDLNDIRKNYEKMSNFEIERIATTNGQGLRPEVFAIIEDEIKKRNLDPNLFKQVLAQNKEYLIEDIEKYAKILQRLPCPICDNSHEKLNGTFAHTVKSFILFTNYRSEISVACSLCLDKINNQAIISTALLGWWGFPWGIIKTPYYIYKNLKQKSANKDDFPNSALLSFTLANIPEIDTYIENKEKLKRIIKLKS